MDRIKSLPTPLPVDATGVVSWAHVGDLHMTAADQQNYRDLQSIVDRLNGPFSTLNFVYLPGDHAEHGDLPAYELVRSALDRLRLPWFSIIGDHDVHLRTFDPYRAAMLPATWYAFDGGLCRFIALNAFAKPVPDSFTIDHAQLAFLRRELEDSAAADHRSVLFLHCYPSDLKHGYRPVRDLIAQYRPMVVDMGHTHYNEIARDEATVYTTTRSTGQAEEGPVGFSITNIDGPFVSWKFRPLEDRSPFVMITSPVDFRLTPHNAAPSRVHALRARVWSSEEIRTACAVLDDGAALPLCRIAETNIWQAAEVPDLSRTANLRVVAETTDNQQGWDEIQLPQPNPQPLAVAPRDQDNAIGAWPERGILGTQLGPNKNGRKW